MLGTSRNVDIDVLENALDLKVGAKVTIYYTMVATEVEVKETKAKK